MSPLFDWECSECGVWVEFSTPSEVTHITCERCFSQMDKRFTKLTTFWKASDRKWGTSFWRSQKQNKVKKGEKDG
jgi:predicted nucleic acid-binding Zn ribbon protein